MASISSVGIGSGVLTSELIDDLVAVEREAADNRLNAEQENLDAQVSELGNLASQAESLRSAASALTLSSSFQTNTTSSTNESALTATASSLASPGVYTIETSQLARSQSIATAEYSDLDSVLGEGELVFTFGDVDYDSGVPSFSFTADSEVAVRKLDIDASNHTLSGIRDAVNNADMGIEATIVDTGTGYRLLFTSDDTGKDNGFTLSVNNPSNGLDDLAFDDATTTMLQTVDAQDAEFKVNGLDITRESNLVTGVINGLTLNLKQDSAGPVTLTVERDTATVTDRMQSLVDAYNELKTSVNVLTAFDPDTGTGSLFTGDSTVRRLITSSQNILTSAVNSLNGTDFRTMSEVGISTNSDTGLLMFDSGTFQSALQSDAESLSTLFGIGATTTDSLIDYVSSSNDTQVGEYEIVVTRQAEQAQMLGMATSGEPFIIDQGNDGFRVQVDSKVSDQITLAHGSYTGAELAEAIQNAINTDVNIQDAGKSVEVDYNASEQRFELTSGTYGSSSNVGFVTIDTTMALTLGLARPEDGGHSGNTVTPLKTTDDFVAPVVVNAGNDDFTLNVDGITSNSIQIANGSYTSGDDLAAAIQAAINDDSNFKAEGLTANVSFEGDLEGGQLQMSFEKNNDDRQLGYVVSAAEASMATSIGLSAGAGEFDRLVSMDVTDTLSTTLNDTAEFTIEANGITSDAFSIAINSNDGSDIAAALQAAIAADANFIAGRKGAETEAGSVDITAGAIDFTANPRAFGVEYNGTRYDLLVDANGTAAGDIDGDGNTDAIDDILQSVQDQIDATPGLAGNLVADRSGTGLILKTVATGPAETLNVVANGSGAKTALGATAITGTEDFSGANTTTFTLRTGGVDFDITLDADAAAGDTIGEVQSYIQGKIDAELDAHSDFAVGDITVELDGANNLYFQTNSKNGVITSDTIGSGATLEVKNLVDPLNLFPADGAYSAGFDGSGALDGFGIESGLARGEDLTLATVTYDGSTEGGSFKIDFGNDVDFHVKSPNSFASSSLGLVETTNTDFTYATGVNVSGTIGGYAALGSGQRLVGGTGTPVEDLRINVLGGTLGNRGTIDFGRGIAAQLEDFLEDFLSSDGGLGIKQSGLQDDLISLDEDRQALEERIENFQSQLARQFAFNDALVSQLNSTRDYIAQQFEVLNALYSKKD
jgi:flagellar hook-associated protein 2